MQGSPDLGIERRLFASIGQGIERGLGIFKHVDPALSLIVIHRSRDNRTGNRQEPGVVLLGGLRQVLKLDLVGFLLPPPFGRVGGSLWSGARATRSTLSLIVVVRIFVVVAGRSVAAWAS